jgi:hypothetical protein
MYAGIILMCIDCVPPSPRITHADPSRQTPPRGGSITFTAMKETKR